MKQHVENQLLAVSLCSVPTPVEIPSACSKLSEANLKPSVMSLPS